MVKKRKKRKPTKTNNGARCAICGKQCGRGGALKMHVETQHPISYEHYREMFVVGHRDIEHLNTAELDKGLKLVTYTVGYYLQEKSKRDGNDRAA